MGGSHSFRQTALLHGDTSLLGVMVKMKHHNMIINGSSLLCCTSFMLIKLMSQVFNWYVGKKLSCEQFKIFPYIAKKNKIQVLRNHGGKTNLLRKQISRKNFRRILDVSFQSVLGHPPIPKAKKVSTSKRRLFSVRSRTSSDHVFWTKITPRLLSGWSSGW